MVCRIADNRPLKQLEKELNIPQRCHGKRRECIQGFETTEGDYVLGLPGTALGYCQALFAPAGDATRHTENVLNRLEEINAPWAKSHELYWGYRKDASASEFVAEASKPLMGCGRVPILITGLDVTTGRPELASIMQTTPAVPDNESIMVRVVLRDALSIKESAALLRGLVKQARTDGKIPSWWPLFQGDLNTEDWKMLKLELGGDWKYVNVAVNPFVKEGVWEVLAEQVTVAQIPVGVASGISGDGSVSLHPSVPIMGALRGEAYSLQKYVETLALLPSPPTLIILGPSLPEWADGVNQERLVKLFPVLREACCVLWGNLPSKRRDEVWALSS